MHSQVERVSKHFVCSIVGIISMMHNTYQWVSLEMSTAIARSWLLCHSWVAFYFFLGTETIRNNKWIFWNYPNHELGFKASQPELRGLFSRLCGYGDGEILPGRFEVKERGGGRRRLCLACLLPFHQQRLLQPRPEHSARELIRNSSNGPGVKVIFKGWI